MSPRNRVTRFSLRTEFFATSVALISALIVAQSALAQIPGYRTAQGERQQLRNLTYWQQHVDYEINVTLADDGRTISGSEIIIYTNNSPDTLRVLYLKAFPNSARKGSLMDRSNRELENYSLAYSDSSQWGYLRISEARGRGNKKLPITLDDTIYEILLKAPIAPGASARINLEFETRLPSGVGSRHGLVSEQSKAAYWYPQVCVYDRKMGWVNSQYLGRGECYGDFGDFNVTITAPEDRIVTATGILTNPDEVLPDTLRALLDISRFVGEQQSWPMFDFDKTKSKSWNFQAKNVNDFAWVASANFCIDEQMYNGVHIEIFPRRSNARNWVKAKDYAARALETFSELYGDYGWPEIKVTDSYDGMEYPMITFCGGGDPSPTFPLLLYHEIGHFWFMGLVGSNQVDRPFLDEGFTTMAEIVAMEKYHGRKGNNISHAGNWYKEQFYPLDEDRDARGYRIYLDWARSGYDLPMIVPSDNASEYWAYRNSSYYKPVVMHFSLRAIYGDQLYFNAMRTYARKWFFKHPYEDDFVRSFSGVVGERLDEYFAQWLTSRRRIDYKYESHKRLTGDTYTVKLSQPGDFVTPIDIAFINKTADTTFYTVNPEGHHYLKTGYQNGGTWRQYRQPSGKYSFEVTVPGGVSKAVIDPYNLLPDINRLNNESGFLPPIETRVDALFFDVPSMHKYSLRLRPDFWYDQPNGLIVGGHAHGSYIKTDYKFSLDAGIGVESGRARFDLKTSHPFRPLGRLAFIDGRFLHSDFRDYLKLGITKEYRPRWTGSDYLRLDVSVNELRVDSDAPSGFLLPLANSKVSEFIGDGLWTAETSTWTTVDLNYIREGRVFGHNLHGNVTGYQGPFTISSGFTSFGLDAGTVISPSESVRIRLSASVQFLAGNNVPPQFLTHLTRPTPFEAYSQSQVFRSPGSFPNNWRSDFYLDEPVGSVRGYQDRSLYGTAKGVYSAVVTVNNLLSNLGISNVPRIGSYLSRFTTEIFLQTGTIELSRSVNTFVFRRFFETPLDTDRSKIYSSAGVSFVSPSVWNGQKLRFDIPLYLSRPLPGEEKWDFRFSAALVLPLNTERWQ